MAEHPNVGSLKRAYEAFASGDLDTVADVLVEDILWHVPGNNILSGTYKGRDEVGGFFGRLAEETGNTFKTHVITMMGMGDNEVVTLVRRSAARRGEVLTGQEVHVAHLREGKVCEFWVMVDDAKAFDEFWMD